ncbi:MAG: NADH:ubiquinone reductase (Na(+)-transporting) subunit C [Alistipes senegalensis]|nr:NADH:ubiquinone reductase (Na(+)-transporting) subunit C [Bacteroides cellulosilyticus]MCM1352282.1 NADH:ubiquinone reductase (Na(+)-transporting) subunit C [Alistipes senegalensis]
MKKFRCNVCGYIHEGNAAPETCPVCGAPASEFTELKSERKSWLHDKNSNAYILVYATVMVVIVAAVLAVAALSLKSRQDANSLNEKKEAILASLGAAEQPYDEYISAYAVDAQGERIESVSADDALQMLFDLKKAEAAATYPVFEAADGRIVLPVNGTGLWGPIWGYVALEKDMDTVVGAVFDHKGETPGLGAEIATAKYQRQFVGKTIFDGDRFVSITLRKGGAQDPAHEVDAITGGTKTSDGVTAMLQSSLGHYLPLLEARRAGRSDAETPSDEVEQNH